MRSERDFGLVIDWRFHKKNKWVCALTPYLLNAIIDEFNPIIISSQFDYWRHKKRLKYIVSVEPGWSAPRVKYDTTISCKKAVFYSDPHYQPVQRRKYFDDNGFDYVFSYYQSPFFHHFDNFPKDKFVHMPWAIPDEFISQCAIEVLNTDIAIFGGKGSDAYDVRNWCREQPWVKNFQFSGVENKQLSDEGFFKWLAGFDAIIAAGSSNPKYDLVTPKYFEIASSGALLFAQYCKDLEVLGFNESNCLIFTKETFNDKVLEYKANPGRYLDLREKGRQLIRDYHKVSDRINKIKELFYG